MDIPAWIAERYDLTHRLGNWAARGVEPALEGVTWEIEDTWARVRARLERAHEELAAVLAALDSGQLLEPLEKSWLSEDLMTRRIDYAVDIATHDLYHAGQIFVLRRWFASARPGAQPGT